MRDGCTTAVVAGWKNPMEEIIYFVSLPPKTCEGRLLVRLGSESIITALVGRYEGWIARSRSVAG